MWYGTGYMDVVNHDEAFIKDMVTSVAAYLQASGTMCSAVAWYVSLMS